MPNRSFSVSELWERSQQDPAQFTDWLGEHFGYEGYYKEEDEWVSGGFSDQYGMYVPAYDVYGDELAEKKADIETKYAKKTEHLEKRKSDLDAEREVLKLRESYRDKADQSLEAMSRMGIKHGGAQRDAERLEDISQKAAQKVGTDTLYDYIGAKHDREKAIAKADLTKKASVYDNKQDWFNAVMRSLTHLAERGIFQGAPDITTDPYEFAPGEEELGGDVPLINEQIECEQAGGEWYNNECISGSGGGYGDIWGP